MWQLTQTTKVCRELKDESQPPQGVAQRWYSQGECPAKQALTDSQKELKQRAASASSEGLSTWAQSCLSGIFFQCNHRI